MLLKQVFFFTSKHMIKGEELTIDLSEIHNEFKVQLSSIWHRYISQLTKISAMQFVPMRDDCIRASKHLTYEY